MVDVSRFSTRVLPSGARMACRIEYCGSDYNGWQAQPHLPNTRTVQTEVERALTSVANAPVRVHCAGRTDSGVHAFGQIVHFDAPAPRSSKAWVMGGNAALPDDVRVHWAIAVNSDFHARFSALARSYRYIVANTPVRPALLARQVTWQRRPLDADAMHRAAQCLLGENDFSAFRAASCQSNSPMRCIHSIAVRRQDELVIIDVKANAFLHHMVRNIAGSLMAVGQGRGDDAWLAAVLAGRDRRRAADTARPDGLYLLAVDYPPGYGLPELATGALLPGR